MSGPDPESAVPVDPETGRAEEHQLPPDFIFLLCGSLAGGLPAGIFTTLISEPGRSGSPIYGLLLPWGILPFFLALVAGWRGRRSPALRRLAWFTSSASVVGLPAHLDGNEHALSRLSRKFAQRLHGRFSLPVILVDERLSSAEASRSLKQAGLSGRRQKPVLDQVAAQTILQSYFDSHSHAPA